MSRWATLLLLGGCVPGTETEPLPLAGSVEAYADRAQPVFAARCANPSCHGSAERPFSVYAVHRRRLDGADVYLDTPLSDAELRHNLLQASVFLQGVGDASQSMLITKPLGGHAGVQVFVDTADYDYRQLHAWIEAVLEEGDIP